MNKNLKDSEKILKALASRRRLAIIRYLHKRKRAHVGSITEEIKLSFAATSRHLNILFAADIVERQQVGLTMNYFLTEPPHPLTKTALTIL